MKRKPFKKVMILALTAVVSLSTIGCQPSVKAETYKVAREDIQVNEEALNISEENIEGEVKIPSMLNLSDSVVQDKINATLKDDIMSFVDSQKYLGEHYKEGNDPSKLLIDVSSEITFKGQDLVSILILKQSKYEENYTYKIKTAYTFDLNTGKNISLDKLINGNEDYRETIRSYIEKNYKEKSNIRKSDIKDNQYYLRDGKLYIFFNGYGFDEEVNDKDQYHVPFEIFKEGVDLQPKLEPYAVELSAKRIKESNEYFETDMNIPVVSGLKDEKVQGIINKRFEEDALEFKNKIEGFAKEAYEESLKEGFTYYKYSANITFEEKRNQGEIVSIYVVYHQYTGGAHGMYYPVTYNIDLKTGNLIALKDLFYEGTDYIGILDSKVREQIQAINEEEKAFVEKSGKEDSFYSYYEGYEGINEDQLYYLTDDKLGIYFGLYEIAPYAEGIPTFEIPLEDLKEYMEPIE
ncbi:hypothetical protein DW1_2852 [Proteiniborus sp. DW1]|uniref:PdaC/SigV domain-containing protein n=1 Tax=Proteiniborus sp. DW1 TaxID=1889883 RepID=UPI00092DF7E1|nr:DUF4163 domain-containing protein [Proteiniborus sp. DW1]SCG84412.1 hypothetical protein DW1_2852 [Proteiniborus sp. DW1]